MAVAKGLDGAARTTYDAVCLLEECVWRWPAGLVDAAIVRLQQCVDERREVRHGGRAGRTHGVLIRWMEADEWWQNY